MLWRLVNAYTAVSVEACRPQFQGTRDVFKIEEDSSDTPLNFFKTTRRLFRKDLLYLLFCKPLAQFVSSYFLLSLIVLHFQIIF